MMITAYLGLGSNVGDKQLYLQKAVEEIAELPETKVLNISSIYITKPWGKVDQEDFMNQVAEIKTGLSAQELLWGLQKIEINMGRQRIEKWGPRIIDIDILLYGNELIHTEELKVPHPYLKQRLFVLVPLAEINENVLFPDDGTHIQEVLSTALDRDEKNYIRKL